jgi:hypothetical protein
LTRGAVGSKMDQWTFSSWSIAWADFHSATIRAPAAPWGRRGDRVQRASRERRAAPATYGLPRSSFRRGRFPRSPASASRRPASAVLQRDDSRP